jgi:hypothetical protein
MAENLITQSELEAYAPDLDLSEYSAATISGMISRASEQVRKYCNVDGFFQAAVTNESGRIRVNGDGELIISFRRRPVEQGAVSAIRLVTVDVNQTLTLTSNSGDIYFINSPGNYLIYPSNYIISHGYGLITLQNARMMYQIDYTGGYATDVADLPPDLKEATTLMVRDVLATRYNPTGVKSFSQGSYSQTNAADGMSTFVRQARNILDSGNFVRMVV